MKLSIIIVTYNSARDIEPCLDSIKFDDTYEIIVIDNASKDETQAILARRNNLKTVSNNQNLGYARANNQGLELARGEYLLLLNPDTVLTPAALNLLATFLDQNPDVAAVAPRLLNPDSSQQLSIRSFPTFSSVMWELTGLARLFPHCGWLNKWRRRDFDYERFQYVQQPMASCLLFRRAVLSQLGGLDESFPIYYNDVDLAFRLYLAGEKIAYLPTARVYHKLGASTSQMKPKMIYENHRSLFRFLKKYNSGLPFLLKALILLPLLELSALCRVIIYRLKKWGATRGA